MAEIMSARTTFRCPGCSSPLKPRIVARNRFCCPHCGETVRVKRWSGFQLISSFARAAVFATLYFAGLVVFHSTFWVIVVALFGAFVLFYEWDSIVLKLLPPKALEIIPFSILRIDRP